MTATALTAAGTSTQDSFLRLMMRADGILTGLVGLTGLPLAGWIAEISGTEVAMEYAVAAFFLVYGATVFALAALPSVRRAGLAVIIANIVYTAGVVGVVIAGVIPFTTTGVVLALGSGVYTLVFADLQYVGWRRLQG